MRTLTKLGRHLINPSAAACKAIAKQRRGYQTGEALTAHTETHGGEFDPKCPACLEIVRKMDKANGLTAKG